MDHFPVITSATWTYSKPGHGKGPVDGVGGVLKKTADDYVLKGKDVRTAADFVNLFKKTTVLLQEITDDEIVAVKKLVPGKLDAIPGIMNVTKITWQKASDVLISLYQHAKLLKKIKLETFSIEEQEPEAPTSELMDIDMEVSAELLPLSFNRESIYQAVYGSSSSDDEDLQTLSDRLHGHENDIHVGTSYSQNKENLHPYLICPRTFCL